MTAVLQLLQDIAQHLEVKTSVTSEQLRDLMKKTDVRRLTNRLEELAEPATPATRDKSEASREALKAASLAPAFRGIDGQLGSAFAFARRVQ